ncbi:hypothetical protein EON77_00030 [bacterium]|nr:MAG: hypothetical protein EON77_00030 [bacterium]
MHTDREPVDMDTLSEMGYERRDVNYGSLTKWIVAFFGLGFTFFLMAYGFFYWLAPKQIAAGRSSVLPVTKRVPAAPNPLLQNNVETKIDIQRMRQDEVTLLTSYAWVDQGQGVVRLPIERAKQLLVQRGVRPTGNAVAPITRPDASPRNVTGETAADKAPGGANAGDTAPRTQIPTSIPTRDPNRNGGVTEAPTGSDAPASNASNPTASRPSPNEAPQTETRTPGGPAGAPGTGRE